MKDFDFSKRGAFFAFSQSQLDQQKKEGVEYTGLKSCPGLVARKDNYKEMIKAFVEHNKQERQKRLELDGIDKIIAYELDNYECFIKEDITDVLRLCNTYGITEKKIREVFNKEKVNLE